MKDDLQHARHRPHETAAPTVIHHYEEDETILARWLRRGMEKGAKFWFLLAGTGVAISALTYLASGLAAGRTEDQRAWLDLMLAKDPDEQVKVAESFPTTKAALWARLQAAEGRYQEALNDLPANREAARPVLNQALDWFRQIADDAPAGSPLKRLAAMGVARTLEARNELDDAIKQYESIAKNPAWRGTAEAIEADRRAAELRKPQTVAFYKAFYAYTPKSLTLPPGGREMLGLPAGHPDLDSPAVPAPPLSGPAATPKTGGGELPQDVFTNNPPPPPKAAKDGDAIPVDIFTPPSATDPEKAKPKAP
jgi:hypothetical protein